MRIIAGTARGIKLEAPDGEETRPTLGRVKENYFNAINFEIAGARVLDLFAGSGQLGLEALSRGARECAFVDKRAECVDIIRKNAQRAKLYGRCNILKSEYSEYLSGVKKRREFERFDMVFLDPPYKDNARILREAVKRLAGHEFMSEGGLIICEGEAAPEFDGETARRVSKTRAYRYGRVWITILNIGGQESGRKNMRDTGDV